MAPWYIEYFKLKESEKEQVQEGFSDLPLKQVVRPSVRGALPIPGGKEYLHHPRQSAAKRNLNEQVLGFPSLLHSAYTLFCSTPFLPQLPTLHQTYLKNTQV